MGSLVNHGVINPNNLNQIGTGPQLDSANLGNTSSDSLPNLSFLLPINPLQVNDQFPLS